MACNNIATIGTTQWPKSAPDPTFECVIWDESGDSTVCHGTQQLMDFTCVSQILVFWSSFERTEHRPLHCTHPQCHHHLIKHNKQRTQL